jgi:hypothetical protein
MQTCTHDLYIFIHIHIYLSIYLICVSISTHACVVGIRQRIRHILSWRMCIYLNACMRCRHTSAHTSHTLVTYVYLYIYTLVQRMQTSVCDVCVVGIRNIRSWRMCIYLNACMRCRHTSHIRQRIRHILSFAVVVPIYMHAYIHIYTHAYVHIYTYYSACVYNAYIHIYTHAYIHIYTYYSACVYAYTYACTRI